MRGHLVAPYIWIWMLARLPMSEKIENLCQFLKNWQFNDYAELLHLATGEGLPGNTTWQNFEVFCCSFRALLSLGFENGETVPLASLHSGCKLRDDDRIMIANRHLGVCEAAHQYRTDSRSSVCAATDRTRDAKKVVTRHSGTLDPDAQLRRVFFLSLKLQAPSKTIIHEIGQCKLVKKKLTQATYNEERKNSASPEDIFILYTNSEASNDFPLPNRFGLVDAPCWDSYFGPFAGRAYMTLRSSQDPR
jgi:hypothetical protein